MPKNGGLDLVETRPTSIPGQWVRTAVNRPRIFILSGVRLFREGLALSLSREETVDVVGTGAPAEALVQIADLRPEVVLLDSFLIEGPTAPRRLREIVPETKVVAFAVLEIDQAVIDCAEAGIAAYVACEGTAGDLVDAVHQAIRGEVACSPRLTSLLFGRLATLSAARIPSIDGGALTPRESEIIALIELGLSNKEIAHRLRIGTATIKNHVHNILEKLQVHRRGEVAARMRRDRAFADAGSARSHTPNERSRVAVGKAANRAAQPKNPNPETAAGPRGNSGRTS
jgi:DNA-binding NarL/FixJ family response regulator